MTWLRRVGNYVLPAFLIAGGLFAWAITSGMNIEQHLGVAHTERGVILQGASAFFVDSMVVLSALVFGALCAMRKRISATLCAVLIGAFAMYSLWSVIEFGLSERVGKANLAVANQARADVAVEKANTASLSQQDLSREFLQKEIRRTRGAEKQALTKSLLELNKAPVAIQVASVATVDNGDTSASVTAKLLDQYLGIKPEAIVTSKLVMLALLLIVGKTMCFGFGSFFWTSARAKNAALTADARAQPMVEPEPIAVPLEALPVAQPASQSLPSVQTVEDEPETVDDEPYETVRERRRREAMDRAGDDEGLVAAFLAAAKSSNAQVEASAHDVYTWFCDWCRAHGYLAISQKRFGTHMRALGAVRAKAQYVSYFGLQRPTFVRLANVA